MIQQIQNFAIRPYTTTHWEALPYVYLTKFKRLQKLVNFLLKRLGAYHIDKGVTIQRIIIECDTWLHTLQSVIIESQKRGLMPTHIIVGYDVYSKILRDTSLTMMMPSVLDTENLLGFRLILHPGINGVIPITI